MADPNSPIETLLQSLKPATTAALNTAGYAPGAGAFVAPQVALPQLSPTAQYVQDMQTLMQGGLGKLSTGEKLGALGQLLQAAGSRGAVDPGAVIGKVREQQMQKLNAQYQIAQLQQKTQQEAKQRAFIQQYASVLPESKRGVLENADTAEAFKLVQEEAFRPKQVLKHVRDAASGMLRIEFQDGSSQLTDRPMPRNTEDRDVGGAIQVVDKDTGNVVATIPKTMAPGEAARLAQAEREFQYRVANPNAGGGDKPSYLYQEGPDGFLYAINKDKPEAPPIKTKFKPATAKWTPQAPGPLGAKRY
jgi:hypothetical protein